MDREYYENMVDRNIGMLSEAQQEKLKGAAVAVFGVGGLGGVIAEILCRTGIGGLTIVDDDKLEATNLNRHIYAFRDTLRKRKIDVAEKFLKKINPGVKIKKYSGISEKNIEKILKGVSAAVLAIDSAKPCLILSRACRRLPIPLVEGWAIPFGNVRVLTQDTPSLEEVYGFPTAGKSLEDISAEELGSLKLHMLTTLTRIEGVQEFYPPQAVERIKKGFIPSFAPLVWLTAVLMSLEAVKIILNWGRVSYAPHFALYNPFNNSIPKQET